MASTQPGASYRDYLCVEPFIADIAGGRALSSAFELGVIDALIAGAKTRAELQHTVTCEARGLDLLLGMLRANRVIDGHEGTISLTAPFRVALGYRDLMVEKLNFAHLVAPDFTAMLTVLLTEPRRFFESARLFDLFSYQRCFESTSENVAATQRWMNITTALTRYEAAACLAHYDFSPHRRQLDVGGNSGEFVLQICRQHAGLRATVYDLPVVCEIGARHVASVPEGLRIGFAAAPPGGLALPGGHDLISFKSMLHDWPDAQMLDFLRAAYAALAPGGSVLIYERGMVQVTDKQVPYAMLPLVLFFRSYRTPDTYAAALREAGFRDIVTAGIELDMAFILVSAKK
jgi:hypothetical protein